MHAHLSVITLAVHDLQTSLDFYCQGLGLKSEGIIGQEYENGAVAFIELQSGLKLDLWPQQSLSQDTGLAISPLCPTGFSLGHNVSSAAEVDHIMTQAAQAGANITKAAQTTLYGGYAGYFQDPNGHLWEIVWNPCWEKS